MTTLAYFDCPTGIAGDMCLGALLDLGVPLEYLQQQLQRLGLSQEFSLRQHQVLRQGQRGIQAVVELTPEHHSPHAQDHSSHPSARHLPDINHLIQQAGLPLRAEAWSLAIFQELAIAEGSVHGIAPEKVHFHEVGATDAIVDIVGTCLGLDWLGVDQLFCSPFPTGGGTVRAAHGRLAVPVPAVLQLWQRHQVPVYSNGIERELVTPTGAAIAVTLADGFGPPPRMKLQRIGLGAGSQELALPNLLRLWIGEVAIGEVTAEEITPESEILETVVVLETQLDDLNPQAIGYAFEALFAAGAVDVFTQAIGMKKSRPGVLLTVICPSARMRDCEAVLFRETTTLGIRRSRQQRVILARQMETIETRYGPARLKIARQGTTVINVQPEFEDCAQLARQHQLPWQEIHRCVLWDWYAQHPRRESLA
jgi:pyridinium-3,5-bisthiocarboxylic acid mononucleotide nickel chelatase